MLDKIIFGDNQFFGINHMSEDKALAQSMQFRDIDAIIKVIDQAYDAGIHAFMFNSHDRVADICEHFRSYPEKYDELSLYVSMPYAHKYASAVAEKGIFGAIKDVILAENSAGELIELFSRGGLSLFEKDLMKVMEIMIDMEMAMFKGLNVKAIFIQNIVTDLLLGFGLQEFFIAFSDYIRNRYGVEPGFVTLNLPRLVHFLKECEIKNPVVCSTINIAGYNMNPNRESYEKVLNEGGFQPMAMAVLASGAIQPEEAIRYVAENPTINSIVFGASSSRNILKTKELINKYI